MTAQATPIERPTARRYSFWRAPALDSLPLRVSVVLICLLWTLPTAGLLVTSVRNPALITRTGWWDGLLHLFERAEGRNIGLHR